MRECEHGKRIGKAGLTELPRMLPWSGMFCPENKCEPIFFITKVKGEHEGQ